MKLRNATSEDCSALEALVNSAYRGEGSKQGWTTEADLIEGSRISVEQLLEVVRSRDSVIRIFEDQRGIIACVHLKETPRGIYLGMLTVKPNLQSAGIGKKLVQDAFALACQKSLPGVWMTVIHTRKELIAWYERQGFRQTGERQPFPTSDPRQGVPKVPASELEFVVLEASVSRDPGL